MTNIWMTTCQSLNCLRQLFKQLSNNWLFLTQLEIITGHI